MHVYRRTHVLAQNKLFQLNIVFQTISFINKSSDVVEMTA